MKNIRWVVQNNLYSENDYNKIKDICFNLGIDFQGIQVIPFSEELPEFTLDEKINLYYGSTTLINNVYKKLNKPTGILFNENFSMENYLKKWGNYMLNSEAQITTFEKFSKQNHSKDSLWFIRPDADDKSFAGDIMSFEDIVNWRSKMIVFDNVVLNEQTKIIISTPYNIVKEWRNYIINGKVVTSSLYRKNFRLNKSRLDIPKEMIEFVENRCKEYQPHELFVMDIALCGGEYYIIECGCMNSVGFYDCDVALLIESITNHFLK